MIHPDLKGLDMKAFYHNCLWPKVNRRQALDCVFTLTNSQIACVGVWTCRHVHLYMYVGAGTWMCHCTHAEDDNVGCLSPPSTFLDCVSLLVAANVRLAGLCDSKVVQTLLFLSPASRGGTGTRDVWGSKLRASHFCGEQFAHRALPLVPQ